MPLDKMTLKKNIFDMLEDLYRIRENPRDSWDLFADKLSNAIYAFVKSGDVVNVNSTVMLGIPVQVTPTSGTGATTAIGLAAQNNIGKVI